MQKINFDTQKQFTAANVLPNKNATAESLKVAKKSFSNSAVKKVGESNLILLLF